MHILILPSWYDTVDEPWRGAAVRDQAIALSAAGVQTGVVHVERRGFGRANPFSFIGSHGQTLLRDEDGVATARMKSWDLGTRVWLRATRRLFHRYTATFGKPDIIHAHGEPAARAARMFGLPVVTAPVTIVDTDYFTPGSKTGTKVLLEETLRELPRWHVREWLRGARAVLVSSETSDVALRAQSAGVPVFTDANALANAPRREREAVRAEAIERFGYEAFVARVAPLYAKALRRPIDISMPVSRSTELPLVRPPHRGSAPEPRAWR